MERKVTYLPDVHRLLPQAPDAEMGTLSSLVLAPREVGAMCAERGITSEFFHIPAHGEVYAVLILLWDAGKPVDFISITQHLRDRDKLDGVGGAAFISSLFTFLATATNANYYLNILVEKAVLRRIIEVCTTHAARSYDEQGELPALLDGLEAAVMSIRPSDEHQKDASMKELVMESVGEIQRIYENRGKILGIETGLRGLDLMTDGLHDTDLVVIAARPSMGKSAIALNIAERMALDGMTIGFLTLEMSAKQLSMRLLCSVARVNLGNIRNGFLSERDFPALTAAATTLAAANIKIHYRPSITILELKAKARRMKQQHGIKCLIVDYLQLIAGSSKRSKDNRVLEIGEISAGLKALAGELNIPVIALAQLNRGPEQRQGGRPRMSDLRESGNVEQDADVVMLLHREDYYAQSEAEKEEMRGKATLIVAKNRHGPTGDVNLTFIAEFTRFEDRAESIE